LLSRTATPGDVLHEHVQLAAAALCEHAYQKTHRVYRRRHELTPILARHGIRIRPDLLKEKRSLVHHDIAGMPRRRTPFLAASHRLGFPRGVGALAGGREAGRKAACRRGGPWC
jgi:hypothetical protein